MLSRFMKEKYTPFILSTKGKALALFGTAAILAAGIYGVTQVRNMEQYRSLYTVNIVYIVVSRVLDRNNISNPLLQTPLNACYISGCTLSLVCPDNFRLTES